MGTEVVAGGQVLAAAQTVVGVLLAGLPLPHDVAGGTPSVQEEQVAMLEVEWQEGTFPVVEWQRAYSLAGVLLL